MMTTAILVGGAATPAAFWRRVVRHLDGLSGPDGAMQVESVVVARPLGADHLEVEVGRVAEVARAQRARSAEVVLVGHSMGGFVVEAVARLHPDLVDALVLVDASVTQDVEAPPPLVTRGLDLARGLPDPVRRGVSPVLDWFAHAELGDQLRALRAEHPCPALPVEVLTVIPPAGVGARTWRERQVALADLLVGEGATVSRREGPGLHALMLDRPDVVVDAVLRAARSVRQRRG